MSDIRRKRLIELSSDMDVLLDKMGLIMEIASDYKDRADIIDVERTTLLKEINKEGTEDE